MSARSIARWIQGIDYCMNRQIQAVRRDVVSWPSVSPRTWLAGECSYTHSSRPTTRMHQARISTCPPSPRGQVRYLMLPQATFTWRYDELRMRYAGHRLNKMNVYESPHAFAICKAVPSVARMGLLRGITEEIHILAGTALVPAIFFWGVIGFTVSSHSRRVNSSCRTVSKSAARTSHPRRATLVGVSP